MQTVNKIDIRSLPLGVLVSLVAQGIWSSIVDYSTGSKFTFYIEILLTLTVIGLILNLIVYAILLPEG